MRDRAVSGARGAGGWVVEGADRGLCEGGVGDRGGGCGAGGAGDGFVGWEA